MSGPNKCLVREKFAKYSLDFDIWTHDQFHCNEFYFITNIWTNLSNFFSAPQESMLLLDTGIQ